MTATTELDRATAAHEKALGTLEGATKRHADAAHLVSELEAEGAALALDEAAIKRHLKNEDAAHLDLKVAERMLAQATAAVEASESAKERAAWQCEHDRLARRCKIVSEELAKYDQHAGAIVAMLAAAKLLEHEVTGFMLRAGRLGRQFEVNLPAIGIGHLWNMRLIDLYSGAQLWPMQYDRLSEVALPLPEV